VIRHGCSLIVVETSLSGWPSLFKVPQSALLKSDPSPPNNSMIANPFDRQTAGQRVVDHHVVGSRALNPRKRSVRGCRLIRLCRRTRALAPSLMAASGAALLMYLFPQRICRRNHVFEGFEVKQIPVFFRCYASSPATVSFDAKTNDAKPDSFKVRVRDSDAFVHHRKDEAVACR
jgi:hypothetical protein